MTPPPAGNAPRHAWRAYGASIAAMGRARLLGLVALVLGGALTEGLGIVLLVPLIALLFGAPGQTGTLGRMIGRLTGQWGLSGALALMLGGFVALIALRAGVGWQRDSGLQRLSAELVDRWRARVIAALIGADWRSLRALDRGAVEFAATSDVARLAIGSDRLLRGAVALVQIMVLMAMALRLSPVLAAAELALLIPALPIGRWLARAAHRFGQDLTRDGARRQSAFAEFMAGMKLARAHGADDRYADEFVQITNRLRQRAMAYAGQQVRGTAAFQVLVAVLAALLLWTGLVVLHVPPALLSAMLVLFARLPGPLLQLAQGTQAMAMMLPAIANLVALESDLAPTTAPVAASALPALDKPPTVALIDIAVQLGPDRTLFSGLDLTLPGGALIVLEGPSGSGKTTLADLIIGLTTPDRGQVCVAGCALDDPATRAAWRQRIGYVPQDPFLFDRSIGENLRWAAPQADDAALWAALEAADAADFVRALPAGLDTRAGDRGGHFSGGERQRLCLARALVRRPALLVLDEATNALDRAAEARLLHAIARLRGQMTVLMITHRLPAGFVADRAVRIAAGRLVE